ncbi:hypothetical protein KK141_05845 [Dyella sp. LX-66]|uniref:hypothetical protein n=1 Tax=unclassified Dyella TaxID=2634549 RepID=UPI001BE0EF6D|nr:MULTISPECIES: hypothetical protein [unclassified Dyella]MBT2116771.1 hypothetical protein [Dyella sp. LX-1]MBT2139049.1 hypothetical protein [Dyella sp. LX-66]
MVGSVSGSSGSNAASDAANAANQAANAQQDECTDVIEHRPCTAAEKDVLEGLGDAAGEADIAAEAAKRAKSEPDACAAEAAAAQAQRAAAASQVAAGRAAAAAAREPTVSNRQAAGYAADCAREAAGYAADAAASVKAGNTQKGTIGCVSQAPANPTPTLSASMIGQLDAMSVNPYGAGITPST